MWFSCCLSRPVCLSHNQALLWFHQVYRSVCSVRFGLWLAACELLFRFYCRWTLSKSDSCVLKGKLESAFSLGNSCRIKLSNSSLMSQGFPSRKPAAKTETIIHVLHFTSLYCLHVILSAATDLPSIKFRIQLTDIIFPALHGLSNCLH